MNDLEKVQSMTDPANQQVVLLKDVGKSTTDAGVYLPGTAVTKFKSGVVAAFAADCKQPFVVGGRVGYQRHAGTDMTIIGGGESVPITVMHEGSITMLLKGDAKLDGGE